MKNWKRLAALCLSGAMVLSLSACGSFDSTESPSAGPSEEVSADPNPSDDVSAPEIDVDLTQSALQFSAGISPTDVMLTVNGEDIPADLFCYNVGMTCAQTQQYMAYFGMSLADLPDMGPSLLEQGINQTAYYILLRQKAAELGCLLTDDQTAAIKQTMDETDLENVGPMWDLTDESLKFIFEVDHYNGNLYNALTHDPSDDELNDYLYRVKHILLKTMDDSSQPLPDEEIEEKKAQAEDILAQLQAADDLPSLFDQLMKEYSEDGRDENGDLYAPDGYLAGPGEMVSEFENASKALKEGELSGIVESDYGYHIILRLPTALDTLTDDERLEYSDAYRQDALNDQIDQWMAEAQITRAPAADSMDPIDFFTRLAAYQQALMDTLDIEGEG